MKWRSRNRCDRCGSGLTVNCIRVSLCIESDMRILFKSMNKLQLPTETTFNVDGKLTTLNRRRWQACVERSLFKALSSVLGDGTIELDVNCQHQQKTSSRRSLHVSFSRTTRVPRQQSARITKRSMIACPFVVLSSMLINDGTTLARLSPAQHPCSQGRNTNEHKSHRG